MHRRKQTSGGDMRHHRGAVGRQRIRGRLPRPPALKENNKNTFVRQGLSQHPKHTLEQRDYEIGINNKIGEGVYIVLDTCVCV